MKKCTAYKLVVIIIFIRMAACVSADTLTFTVRYDESEIDSLNKIVSDSGTPYTGKFEAVSAHSGLSLYAEYFEKLYPLYNRLLEEASGLSDVEGMFYCYCSIANLFFCSLERDSTELYLNKAEAYVGQVKKVSNLALYYSIKAQYIQHYIPERMTEAVNHYQLSLSCYDKLGEKGQEEEIAVIWRNLSIDAFFRNDSVFISKAIRKLKELKDSRESPIIEFYYVDVVSILFTVYYHCSPDDRLLDSTIVYIQKCLDLNDKGLLPRYFDYICVDLYTIVAETISMKKEADIAVIDSLLSIAMAHNVDSMGMARAFQTKARTFFDRNMLDSAEAMVLKSQSYLEAGYKNNDYSLEKRNFDFLCAIYEIKEDYRKVIEYNYLWLKRTDEIRANEVKKLMLQFEAERKDAEWQRLYAEGVNHENRYKLFFLICALLCLTTLFLLFFLQFKKRSMNSQLALIDAEREETKLKLKLKEEQTVKMQLEKYITLSDFRLKELELIGKTKDLEQLYKDKEALDEQVELFRQKVELLEASIKTESPEGSDLEYVIREDLRRLFARQPSGDRYIEKIEQLGTPYLDKIMAKCNGALSPLYLKYCMCFAIGMGTNEIAECFNIELSSVHMIRYRLKKKFGLGNDDDDLSLFLKKTGV